MKKYMILVSLILVFSILSAIVVGVEILGYDSIADEPTSDGTTDTDWRFAGDVVIFGSDRQIISNGMLLTQPPDGDVTRIDVNISTVNGNPQNGNFIYDIYICPTDITNFTGASYALHGACNDTATLVVNDYNLSANFGGTTGVKQIPIAAYTMDSAMIGYIVEFGIVSGGLVGAVPDNWYIAMDNNPNTTSTSLYWSTDAGFQHRNETLADFQLYINATPPIFTNDADDSGGSVTEGVIVNVTTFWNDTEDGLSHALMRTNQSGTWTNVSSLVMSPNKEMWYNTTIDTTGSGGDAVCWNQWANNTKDQWNDTMSDHCFDIIALNVPPQWHDIGDNVSGSMYSSQAALVYTNWTDDTGLSYYIFSNNQTGTWLNDTAVAMTGTQDWSNETYQNTSFFGVLGWRYYANDTDDDWNVTDIQTINILDADNDGDGFDSIPAGGKDCNDNNATQRPVINNTNYYINNDIEVCTYYYENASITVNSSDLSINGNWSQFVNNNHTTSPIYLDALTFMTIYDHDNLNISNFDIVNYTHFVVSNYTDNIRYTGNYFHDSWCRFWTQSWCRLFEQDYVTNGYYYNNSFISVKEDAAAVSETLSFRYDNENITIEDNYWEDVEFGLYSWPQTSLVKNMTILDNTLETGSFSGINFNADHDILNISYNIFNGTGAIFISNSTNTYIEYNVFENILQREAIEADIAFGRIAHNNITNVIYGAPYDIIGILVSGSAYNITNNILTDVTDVTGNNQGGIYSQIATYDFPYSGPVVIEFNDITDWGINSGAGSYMIIAEGANHTVRNNTADNGKRGLHLFGGDNFQVYNNTMTNITGDRPMVISTSGTAASEITDNYFQGTWDNVDLYVNGADNTYVHDNIFNATVDVDYVIRVTGVAENNILYPNTYIDLSGINDNAIFLNDNAANNTIKHMSFTDIGASGMRVDGSNNLLENITLNTIGGDGVEVDGNGNTFLYIDVTEMDDHGFDILWSTENTTIMHSYISDYSGSITHGDGIHNSGENDYYYNNTIQDGSGVSSYCIEIGENPNITIEDNELSACGGANSVGIFLSEASGDPEITQVFNNYVYDINQGIVCELCYANITYNNVTDVTQDGIKIQETDLLGNVTGNRVWDANVSLRILDSYGYNVDDNILYNSTYGIHVRDSTVLDFNRNNIYDTNHGFYGENNIRNVLITDTNITDSSVLDFYFERWKHPLLPSVYYSNITGTNVRLGTAIIDFYTVGVALTNATGTLPTDPFHAGDPDGYKNISYFIEATNVSDDSYIYANISYTNSDVIAAGVTEGTLKWLRHLGDYGYVANSGLQRGAGSTTNDTTYINSIPASSTGDLTSFSIFETAGLHISLTKAKVSVIRPLNPAVGTVLYQTPLFNIQDTFNGTIQTFNLSTPLDIEAGDLLALYTLGSDGVIYRNDTYGNSRIVSGDISGNITITMPATVRSFQYLGNITGGWQVVTGSGVEIGPNYVYGNFTNYSIFAPMGFANSPPQYYNVSYDYPPYVITNSTQPFLVNVTWIDPNAPLDWVDTAWIEHNITGSLTNYTMVNGSFGSNIWNYTYPNITSGTYIFELCANDTINAVNCTTTYSFTVKGGVDPADTDYFMGITIFLSITAFVLIFLAFNLRDRKDEFNQPIGDGAFRPLFVLFFEMGMLVMIVNLGLMVTLADMVEQFTISDVIGGVYTGFLWLNFFILGIMMIDMIRAPLESFIKKKRRSF